MAWESIIVAWWVIETTQHDLEAACWEAETQLGAVEARTTHRGSRKAGISADSVRLPKFSGFVSWAAFYCQFGAVANHKKWTSCEEAMHLLTVFRDKPLTSYTVSQLEQCVRTLLGLWRVVMETTSWQQLPRHTSEPGFAWLVSHCKSLQLSSSHHIRLLLHYLWILSRGRLHIHSTEWETKKWSSTFTWMGTYCLMRPSTRPWS
jgi:hypothetical protein